MVTWIVESNPIKIDFFTTKPINHHFKLFKLNFDYLILHKINIEHYKRRRHAKAMKNSDRQKWINFRHETFYILYSVEVKNGFLFVPMLRLYEKRYIIVQLYCLDKNFAKIKTIELFIFMSHDIICSNYVNNNIVIVKILEN